MESWPLPAGMPPGRYVTPLRDGDGAPPVLWVTETPQPGAGARWAELHPALHGRGLWPLVLTPLAGEEWAPWHDGELDPVPLEEVSGHHPERVLAGLWHALAETRYDLVDAPGAWQDATVELGLPRRWPGLAPPCRPKADPGTHAAEVAAAVFGEGYLGVVPAGRGADAVAVLGWDGALNHTGPAELAAVLRSWEERFGVRVLGLGFDTLELSVAAPPGDLAQARAVAAEHFAFCPDNIAQGPEDFDLYARHLIGAPTWSFWWD